MQIKTESAFNYHTVKFKNKKILPNWWEAGAHTTHPAVFSKGPWASTDRKGINVVMLLCF